MAHRISTSELAERLPEILETVHRQGERFVVERVGEPFGTPASPNDDSILLNGPRS